MGNWGEITLEAAFSHQKNTPKNQDTLSLIPKVLRLNHRVMKGVTFPETKVNPTHYPPEN